MKYSSEQVRLRQALQESRQEISLQYQGLAQEIDFKRKFSESIRRHPLGWIGGAAATGLCAMLFGIGGRRFRKPLPSPAAVSEGTRLAGIGWAAVILPEVAKLLYPVLRPLLLELLGKFAHSGFAKKIVSGKSFPS